jgi:hypothetical protein
VGNHPCNCNLYGRLNHYTWTYVAGEGRNYNVGLLHGNTTGHLLIYAGAKIVTIDFRVFESKKYTFFIEDELCEIRLERRGEEMYYFFEIDKKTDTPLNRERRQIERKYLRQSLLAMAAFAVVVAAFIIWMNYLKNQSVPADEQLARHSRQTVGKVLIREGTPQPEISYHFVANNQGFSAKPSLQSKPIILLNNGMPLETGDEFLVNYVPSNPGISHIDFNKPTERQLDIYRQRAIAKHAQLHPSEAPSLVDCMVKIAYDLQGIAGLADFYFQDATPDQNPEHNQNTFLRLTRDLPFQKKVKDLCW